MLLWTYLEPLRSHPCIEGALLPQNHTTFQVRGLCIISTRSHFLSSTFVPYPLITSDRIGFSILGGSHLVNGVNLWQQMGEPTPALTGTEVKYVARPKEGDVAYVSGAAGATGLIACHSFKHLGCRVIGSAGSKEKVGIWGENCAEECGYMWFETCSNIPKRWKQDETGKLRCRCRNLFVNQSNLFFFALFERLL